jgi:hypothetical protein
MALSFGGEALALVAKVPTKPVGATRAAVKAMTRKLRFMILASYTALTPSIPRTVRQRFDSPYELAGSRMGRSVAPGTELGEHRPTFPTDLLVSLTHLRSRHVAQLVGFGSVTRPGNGRR